MRFSGRFPLVSATLDILFWLPYASCFKRCPVSAVGMRAHMVVGYVSEFFYSLV